MSRLGGTTPLDTSQRLYRGQLLYRVTRRGGYYTQFRGKQHLLAKGPKDDPAGPTYEAALAEVKRLFALETAELKGDGCEV